MGDLNSVDVGQSVHEAILENADVMYGNPLPRNKTLEGVYVDDHIVVSLSRATPRSKRS